MVDLTIKDAGAAATGGGCGCGGCGCGRDAAANASPAGATVATYAVTGMTCDHCARAIAEEVAAIDGVDDVSVDFATGVLTVSSARPIDVDRIVEAVAEAGEYAIA